MHRTAVSQGFLPPNPLNLVGAFGAAFPVIPLAKAQRTQSSQREKKTSRRERRGAEEEKKNINHGGQEEITELHGGGSILCA